MAYPWSKPHEGDIVSCRFPYDNPSAPGPKARPCLVSRVLLHMQTGQIWLEVIPGSGRDTDSQAFTRPPAHTEYEERADPARQKGTHLHDDTRFDFAYLTKLPYDAAYFSNGPRASPVFGHASNGLEAWMKGMKAAAVPKVPAPPVQVTVKKSVSRLKNEVQARDGSKG